MPSWGEECLHEFRGMFAFAIWDAQRHRLFVARDPMGIKPLYFYHSDRYFMFSSEVRTLLGTGLCRAHRSRRADELSDLWIALRSEHAGGRSECASARLLVSLGSKVR
jgi:asparagine synthetase B (glutamine-hydrolysing)